MKARIIKGLIDTGSAARDFIREVCGGKQSPHKPVVEGETRERAADLLESFRNHRRPGESQYILSGKRVITAMDEQLCEFGWPFFNSSGKQFADWITRGTVVTINGDPRRFRVLEIWWGYESIRLRDDQGNEFIVPWRIVMPWPVESDE